MNAAMAISARPAILQAEPVRMVNGGWCAVTDAELSDQRSRESAYLGHLLGRAGAGDARAFRELYDATCDRVYGMVFHTLRNHGYTEDTVQEVYLQIWRGSSTFDPQRGSPIGWILMLAHRRAVDRVRSEQAGADRDQRYTAHSGSRDHDEVVEAVVQRLESSDVAGCLQTLSGKQRDAILLAYYGGLSYPEVAARIGVGLSAVKSRVRDGLQRLKTCLGASDD